MTIKRDTPIAPLAGVPVPGRPAAAPAPASVDGTRARARRRECRPMRSDGSLPAHAPVGTDEVELVWTVLREDLLTLVKRVA